MVMVKYVLECKEYKPSLNGRVIDENGVTLEQRKKIISNVVGVVLTSLLPSERIVLLCNVLIRRRMTWSIGSSVGGGTIDPSSADSPNGGSGTRLIRAIQAFQTKLGARIKELRKDLPMKVFFLMGFYCATAFATVIGQTGDWDILSAALAVVVVEGMGALMYKGSFPLLNKLRSLITVFNYWKAGLSLGLFLDSFMYEMDNIIGSILDEVGLSPKRRFIGCEKLTILIDDGSYMMMATTMMLPMYPRSAKLSFTDLKCDRSRAAVVVLAACWLFFNSY
ncbi:hypothetical protein EZV62_008996 [Acer yangbiense]|uniref:Ycf20-like protein n=1 Tax=Acer yangbiense TaxID=1000413 RepID=A0A5C7IF25_9ROSI|nr:hypothetical protein EZV62_008996 [Acer yangbiense]